jgi:hypothetical protein
MRRKNKRLKPKNAFYTEGSSFDFKFQTADWDLEFDTTLVFR